MCARGETSLVADLHVDAAVGVIRRGTHDRAELTGDAALTADDLAHVLLGNPQLEGDCRILLALHLADVDRVGIVYQLANDVNE